MFFTNDVAVSFHIPAYSMFHDHLQHVLFETCWDRVLFLSTLYASLPWFCVQWYFYAYYTQKFVLTQPLPAMWAVLFSPSTCWAADTTGRAVLGGAALLGVGALCYYGLGLSNEIGAADRAHMWPQIVRDRIRSTYGYFTASLAFTAATAYGISRTRLMYSLMRASPWLVSVQLCCETGEMTFLF